MDNELQKAKTALQGLLIPAALVAVAAIVVQLMTVSARAGAGEEAERAAAAEPAAEAPSPDGTREASGFAEAAVDDRFFPQTGTDRNDVPPRLRSVVVSRGDTLLELLTDAGLSADEAFEVIAALGPVYDPARIRPGQEIHFSYGVRRGDAPFAAAEVGRLLEIEIEAAPDESVVVERGGEGVRAEQVERPLTTREIVATAPVLSSIYSAGRNAGLTNGLVMQLIDLLSFEVDFQREIHPGDRVTVLFEEHYNNEGTYVRSGELLAAEVELRHRTIRMFRYVDSGGRPDYFDGAATTIRKTLLRTPVDGAHITSGYGYRRHPIRGFSHLHRGVDFSGPIGTPVFASGYGTVETLRYTPGFGNHVVVRHRNGYRTLYAHLNGFARGLGVGGIVEQGEVIGYLGNTGLSTGPHLHYEVHYNRTPVNPSSLSFPPERTLDGADRRGFSAAKDALERIFFGREAARPVLTT